MCSGSRGGPLPGDLKADEAAGGLIDRLTSTPCPTSGLVPSPWLAPPAQLRETAATVWQNTGVKTRPKVVTPSIPGEHRDAQRLPHLGAGTGEKRPPAAPRPGYEGEQVIRMGRRRSAPRSTAASKPRRRPRALAGELDDQDQRVLGGEADQHHQADLTRMLLSSPRQVTPTMAPAQHIGTIRMTAAASQLS